jgi:uroporphyrinogen-III synthase
MKTHPLAGKRIVTTRAEGQTRELIATLESVGAVPIVFPTIEIVPLSDAEYDPLDTALKNLHMYHWIIFTSVNGVRNVIDRMRSLGLPLELLKACQIAAIGPATEGLLREHGLDPALRPPEYVAEAILAELRARAPLTGQRFLLLRVDVARAVLREQLRAAGAEVDEIHVYRTTLGRPSPEAFAELRAGVDVITFTSSSTVRNFFALLGDDAQTLAAHALIACIGPITAGTAREMGLRVDLQASEYTVGGLLSVLEAHYAG